MSTQYHDTVHANINVCESINYEHTSNSHFAINRYLQLKPDLRLLLIFQLQWIDRVSWQVSDGPQKTGRCPFSICNPSSGLLVSSTHGHQFNGTSWEHKRNIITCCISLPWSVHDSLCKLVSLLVLQFHWCCYALWHIQHNVEILAQLQSIYYWELHYKL